MSTYTLATTLPLPFDEALAAARSGLQDQGFGVLTEIDLAATLHAKLGVAVPAQVILGACRPQLAYEALQADPSVAAVLPCNVVVRDAGDGTTVVEAFDPHALVGLTGADAPDSADTALEAVAEDAHRRLTALLDQLA